MKWFLRTKKRTDPEVRLFCFPYAGAGATVFATWGGVFPPEVEVVAVQPPGKGWRMGESPCSALPILADQIAEAILHENSGPIALFGHSMGSWLGLEVGRRLEQGGLRPRCLFASGRQAPSVGHLLGPLSHLPDDAFVEAVGARYGGLPPEVMTNPEVREVFLPSLRADFKALETFRPQGGSPVHMPIVALCGEDDPFVTKDHLLPWGQETTGSFDMHLLVGGHFYFNENPMPLQAILARILGSPMASPVAGTVG